MRRKHSIESTLHLSPASSLPLSAHNHTREHSTWARNMAIWFRISLRPSLYGSCTVRGVVAASTNSFMGLLHGCLSNTTQCHSILNEWQFILQMERRPSDRPNDKKKRWMFIVVQRKYTNSSSECVFVARQLRNTHTHVPRRSCALF